MLRVAETAAAHSVHGVHGIDDRAARLVERLGEEQQHVRIAQNVPVDVRLVVVDDVVRRFDILLGVPLARREQLTLAVLLLLGGSRARNGREIGNRAATQRMIVFVVGDRKRHAGIVLRLPLAGKVIGHFPVGGIASALALDRGSRHTVPFADTSGRVVAVEARRRVERHFDQAFARIPDTVAGVLPDGFVVGDQTVLARLHDAAGGLLGLGPFRLVAHGITGPRAVDLGQQAQRGPLRETIGVGRAPGVVDGPRKHLGGIF